MCVYVCNPVLKALNIYSAFIPFFSLFSGIGLFLQNYLYQFYLVLFAIVILINKTFKLFKLVLVVYCTSC